MLNTCDLRKAEPLTLGELVNLCCDGQTVDILYKNQKLKADSHGIKCTPNKLTFSMYGKTWVAFRAKPEA